MIQYQRSVRHTVALSGIGLHSGQNINMKISPAPEDHGIVFRRSDCEPPVSIPARLSYVGDTRLCTTLEHHGVRVGTVEHLLSALQGLGVDNALIDLNGPEVPIMDGSAAPFVFMLRVAGIYQQRKTRSVVIVHETIEVTDDSGEKYCRLLPYSGKGQLALTMILKYSHPSIQGDNSRKKICLGQDSYEREVSRARTFGFVQEIDYLRSNGLARGASLQNAVGLDDHSVVNPEGLRFDDELVTHKLLDAIGDLSLLGSSLQAQFEGFCSGHTLNKHLLDMLLRYPERWSYAN